MGNKNACRGGGRRESQDPEEVSSIDFIIIVYQICNCGDFSQLFYCVYLSG